MRGRFAALAVAALACACGAEPEPTVAIAADGTIAVDGAVVFRRGDASAEPLVQALAPVAAAMERRHHEALGVELPDGVATVSIDPEARFADFVPLVAACLSRQVSIWRLDLGTPGSGAVLVLLPIEELEAVGLACALPAAGPHPLWRIERGESGSVRHVFELVGADVRIESPDPDGFSVRTIAGEDAKPAVRCESEVAWRDLAAALVALDEQVDWVPCPLPSSVPLSWTGTLHESLGF